MLYEYRRYEIAPGMTGALQKRFRDHTIRLMRRHGFRIVGVWSPVVGELATVHYLLSWTDMEERERCFAGFEADEEWQAAFAATPPLTSARSSELWAAADYAPTLQITWPDGVTEQA